jgi:hypothetical protein
MNGMIADARSHAAGAPVGKVIANMITSRFENLYRASLHKAFPAAKRPRAPIHLRLEALT